MPATHGSTPLRAVFLDAGGTIIHLDRSFVLATLAARGLHRTEAQFIVADGAARRRVGEPMTSGAPSDDASRWTLYMSSMLQQLECAGADAQYVANLVERRYREGRLWSGTIDGTADALRQLRDRGLILGVVSNADGRVQRFIEDAGLLDNINFVVDSGAVGVEKPDPRIFHIACERAGVLPQEALHVGDIYEIDVLGARAAGVRALLIDPDDMHAHLSCDRIRNITDLPTWLEQCS